jgi:hypothetical protein
VSWPTPASPSFASSTACTSARPRWPRKPVGILNTAGFYDSLLRLLGHAVAEGFLRREYLDLFFFADTPPELLDRLLSWQPPSIPRAWLSPSQT